MIKQFLCVFFFTGFVFPAYRPYEIAINGPKTQATGGITSAPLLSAENLYNNPAFMINLDRTLIHYELDANIRFKGLTRDYRISFDSIVSAGFFYHSPTAVKKPWRRYGVALSTLYRNDSPGQVGVPGMNVKRLGYVQALPLGKNASLGYNVSAAIGLWNGNFSVFPSFQLGYGHSLHKHVVIGANFISPLYLNWGMATASRVKEFTPYIITLGGKFRLSPNIHLLAEISYQGWDSVYFEENGKREPFDKGRHPFDWYQNVFMNFGLYIHGETKESRNEWKKRVSEMTRPHREAAFQYEKKIKEIQKDDRRERLAKQINEMYKKRNMLYRLRDPYVKGEIAVVDQGQWLRINNEIALLQKEKRLKQKELENIDVLFGAKEIKAKLNEEIATIDEKKTALHEKKKSMSAVQLTETQSRELDEINESINQLNKEIQGKIKEERSLGKNYRVIRQDILDRGDRGDELKPNEAEVYQKEVQLRKLRTDIEKEKIIIQRIKRKNRLPIKGQYYVSYHPEIVYQNDGSFLKMGNISIGFSFSPPRNENLYFSFSLTDKSLLRFTQIHPDNNPAERVKVSVRYTF